MTATRAQGLQFDCSGFSGAASLAAGAGHRTSARRMTSQNIWIRCPRLRHSQRGLLRSAPRSPSPRASIPGVSSSERTDTAGASPRVPLPSTEWPIPSLSATRTRTTRAVAAEAAETESAVAPLPGTERAIAAHHSLRRARRARCARGGQGPLRQRDAVSCQRLEARARGAAASAAKGRTAGGRARIRSEGAQSSEDVQSVDSGTGGEGKEEGRAKRMVENAKNKLRRH
ncbi:hypothetical protein DFH11DRAFT_964543 [Phellopilus nigrolimitatus]|nr:hypothetical protein DFH11DRAFT_964543 [Phellopilus nigrolimitatus]